MLTNLERSGSWTPFPLLSVLALSMKLSYIFSILRLQHPLPPLSLSADGLAFYFLETKATEEKYSSPVTKPPNCLWHLPHPVPFLFVPKCRVSSFSGASSCDLGPTSFWLLRNLAPASSNFLSLLNHSLQHTNSLKFSPLITQPCSATSFLCLQLLKILQKNCLCSVSISSFSFSF